MEKPMQAGINHMQFISVCNPKQQGHKSILRYPKKKYHHASCTYIFSHCFLLGLLFQYFVLDGNNRI